jgi:ribbon-helix-helix CopG family protein
VKRTQIQLDEATYEAVRQRSYEERRSMSAVIRDLVARSVGTTASKPPGRPIAKFSFIGAGRSRQGRLSPVSERHDEALADTAAKRRRRR